MFPYAVLCTDVFGWTVSPRRNKLVIYQKAVWRGKGKESKSIKIS